MENIKIGNSTVGRNSKVYFIADIAANHDGSLSRAKKNKIMRQSRANAAKVQHLRQKPLFQMKDLKISE